MEGEHARVTLQTKQELSPFAPRGAQLKHSSAKHLTSPQHPNRATLPGSWLCFQPFLSFRETLEHARKQQHQTWLYSS